MTNTLKERRKALGLSLRYIAAQAHVSVGSVFNYENGRPGNVIRQKYQAVVDCLERIENERAEARKEEEPC